MMPGALTSTRARVTSGRRVEQQLGAAIAGRAERSQHWLLQLLSEPLQLTNNHTGVMLSLFMQQFPFCFLMLLAGFTEQTVVQIAQALMRQPKLLMLDEPSLGLAPIVVDQVMEVLQRLRAAGTTILLVEQMVERALDIADHAYVLQNGAVIGSGTPAAIRAGDLIRRAYLGAVSDRGPA